MPNTTEPSRTVYIIAGSTAVGKSTIAYFLAKRINGEIINCDSVQLYKYMDIGSAKPERAQMDEIPHHLYGILDPTNKITVAKYQQLALTVIDNVLSRGKTPIVVGGTGLYLNSILYDMSFAAKPDNNGQRRKELEDMAEKNGNEYMFEYLSAVDPEAAARIHPNNIKKIIRAIEAWELGDKVKDLNNCRPNTKYDFKFFGLTMDREWLYERINKRVLKLVKTGLVDEVKNLMAMGLTADSPSMQGIGYKETIDFLEGKKELKETIYDIMKNTRHYAKRQLTWLKRYGDDITWIEIRKGETAGAIIDEMLSR